MRCCCSLGQFAVLYAWTPLLRTRSTLLPWIYQIRKSFPVTYPVSVSMFDPRSKMIILSSNLESMDSNRSCRVSNRLGPASWMKNPAPWTSSGSVHPMRSNECETCLVRGAAFSLDHLTCRVVQTQRWSKRNGSPKGSEGREDSTVDLPGTVVLRWDADVGKWGPDVVWWCLGYWVRLRNPAKIEWPSSNLCSYLPHLLCIFNCICVWFSYSFPLKQVISHCEGEFSRTMTLQGALCRGSRLRSTSFGRQKHLWHPLT